MWPSWLAARLYNEITSLPMSTCEAGSLLILRAFLPAKPFWSGSLPHTFGFAAPKVLWVDVANDGRVLETTLTRYVTLCSCASLDRRSLNLLSRQRRGWVSFYIISQERSHHWMMRVSNISATPFQVGESASTWSWNLTV